MNRFYGGAVFGLGLCFLYPFLSAEIKPPKTAIEVVQMVLCRSVRGHNPVEEVTSPKVGETVLGWTKIRSGLGEVTITHRWLHGKQTMVQVNLPILHSPYRTWSRVTLAQEGPWTLQVLNTNGDILKELAFVVNRS